jgi:CRAL/TRIO domain
VLEKFQLNLVRIGCVTASRRRQSWSTKKAPLRKKSKLGACTAPRESKARVFWYHLHEALSKYKDAQKKGVIFVINPTGAKFSHFDRKLAAMQSDVIKGCWPIRLSCIHICRPPAFVSVILPIIKLFMGPVLRKRFRFHTGSPSKVAESLESAGVPRSVFPSDLGGDFKIS